MNRRRCLLTLTALLLTFATSTASFAARHDRGGYAAISIGHSSFAASVSDINQRPTLNNPEDVTFSTDPLAFGVFGGYRVHRYFAVELGYERLGSYSYHVGTGRGSTTCPEPFTPCTTATTPAGDYSAPIHNVKVLARGSLPFAQRYSFDAAVGGAYTYTANNDPYASASDEALLRDLERLSEFSLIYEVGLSANVHRRWWLRLDYSFLSAHSQPPQGSGNIETIRLSIERRFFGR